jgi:hypothetical protein
MRESDDHATLRMAWTALGLPAMRPARIAEVRDRQIWARCSVPIRTSRIVSRRSAAERYGQLTSGFQSANIPAGLCIQIQACAR